MVTEAEDDGVVAKHSDRRRASQIARSRQLSVAIALLTAVTALVTTVAFIVITTGKRFESSELLPFAAGAVVLVLVFATFLRLVNEEPSLFIRTLRSVLLPGLPQSRKRSEAMTRQLALIRLARQQAERSVPPEEKAVDIEQMIKRSLARLEAEISEVRRRGGINLAMGMSITLLGLGILGYAVYAAPPVQASPTELATYFLPRLSLVLVTEMFAYFFLRLYKLSMTETKYFQNELTGAEGRALAILMASKQEAPSLSATVAKTLAMLDRNHVLEKGQTTVEIEQARIESDSLRGLTAAMDRTRPWARSKGLLNKKRQGSDGSADAV
jgi:hypothetical protein